MCLEAARKGCNPDCPRLDVPVTLRFESKTTASSAPPSLMKATAKIRDEGDTMDSFQISNTAEDRAAVSIHDLHFRVVRDVEATR